MIIGRVCMKKVLISLIMLVPLLTGCANVDTMLTINDDKSASIATSLTYIGDLSSKTDIIAMKISDSYKKFLDPAYKVEAMNGAKFSTITATKSVKDLSRMDLDLSSLGLVSNLPSKKFVEVKKSFLLSSFNIDCTFDQSKFAANYADVLDSKSDNSKFTQVHPNAEHIDKQDIEAADFNKEFVDNMDEDTKGSIIEFLNEEEQREEQVVPQAEFLNSFSIQVPSIASFNNADSINGNVYTWNVKKDGPTAIKLQYVQYSGYAIAFIILLGILLLVILAGKILKHDSQKRIDNIDNIV